MLDGAFLLSQKACSTPTQVPIISTAQPMQKPWVQYLGPDDPLEKETANYSSILAGKTPWMAEPDGLQPMGPQRVGQN